MRLLSIEDLRMLVAEHRAPCVTITLPTHRDPREASQDAVLYRDLVRRAERQLDLGDAGARQRLLGPLRELDGPALWAGPTGGLAVFRSTDLTVFYRLPEPVAESVHVGRRFQVRALLPALRAGARFLLLTLSQSQVTLYQGTARELQPVHVAGLPASMADALGPEWRLRFVTGHSAGHGQLVFHGQGAPSDDAKPDLVRFFRAVDEGLWPHLRELDLPLILAGVDYYHPLFRQVTRYRHLTDEGITGNVDHDGPAQLLAKARPIVEGLARAREDEVLAEYARHERHGRTTAALEAIGYAAVRGRVRRLLLSEGAGVSGQVDRETGYLTRRVEDNDALEDLAEMVLVRGGEVLAVSRGRLPGDGVAAATLRW